LIRLLDVKPKMEEIGLLQRELAEMLGISQPYLNQIINGYTEYGWRKHRESISTILGEE